MGSLARPIFNSFFKQSVAFLRGFCTTMCVSLALEFPQNTGECLQVFRFQGQKITSSNVTELGALVGFVI